MIGIKSVATWLPPFKYTTDDIRAVGKSWLHSSPAQAELFDRLARGTKIDCRYFALDIQELVKLQGAEQRARIFQDQGSRLLIEPVEKVLVQANLKPEHVKNFVFTSCSVPTIPSLDAHVLPKLGFLPNTRRLPIYQHGCVGGACGLGLGAALCEQSGTTIVASVELCSLIYHASDLRSDNIVGAALFGDGSAAVVLDNSGFEWGIRATASHLIPETTHLMGYDVMDGGSHLRLDRDIPFSIAQALPEAVGSFLKSCDLSQSDIAWWLIHPGGAKILKSIESLFELTETQMQWSWQVLREFGNMSSASLLFALKLFLDSKISAVGDRALMVGIGPGLTLEMLLLERQ